MVILLLVVAVGLLIAAAAEAWRRMSVPGQSRVHVVLLTAAFAVGAVAGGLAVIRTVLDPGAGPTSVDALVTLGFAGLFFAAMFADRPRVADGAPPPPSDPTAAPHYRELVENALDVIVMLDEHGTVRYANPAIGTVLGYDPDHLVGASVFPSVHPEDRDRVERFFTGRVGIPGAAPILAFRFRHKDGSWRHLEAAASNLLRDPSVRAVAVAARDVTDRIRTEAALEDTTQRLTFVVENTPVVLFALDAEGRFTLSEGRGLQGIGLRPGEVVGQSVWELYGSYPKILHAVRRVLEGREVRETVQVGDVAFDIWYTPMLSPDAQVVGVVGVASDVTDRERAFEALQRSAASFRALVEHATYGMYRSTADGAFVSVNPALVRMLGYDSEEDLLRADIARDVYADPRARAMLVERYAAADRIDSLEVEWRRRDGTPILVRLGGRLIRRVDGSIESYEMIVEDVTERRALEEQLRQAQKMEAIGQLTGGIAHDFNNLLTVILANADILEAELPAGHEGLASDLEEVRRAARRGSDMVRKLLGYSRRGVLAMKSVDVCALLSELIPTLRRLLPEHVEVWFEPATRRARVIADEGALEQVLFNLATNARDAMPRGGTLTLVVDRVTVDRLHPALEEWGAEGDFVRITATDTGTGMDESTKARVFDPFFTTKRVGQGTGLGMAMVYGLIKQQGGFIEVESAVGLGTTVNVYLPPDPSDAGEEVPSVHAEEGVQGGAETILLVEDDDVLRRTAARALEAHGYHVVVATDGEDAAQLLERQSVDLIISDLVMPRMSGGQLYERLKKGPGSAKFLFTSGYQSREDAAHSDLDHQVPFLPKPWELRDLLARVREVLDA